MQDDKSTTGHLSAQKAQYQTFDEAVYDNSQPEFDPYTVSYVPHNYDNGPSSGSHLLGGYPPQDTSYESFPYKRPQSPPRYHGGLPKPHRKHPLFSGFEAPKWKSILLHVGMCLAAYPLLMLIVLIAHEKSLFWTRFIVGLGSGIIGVALGLSLLGLARRLLEAATWATVIHQSHVKDSPGIRLRDLAATSRDAKSAWTGFRLLWDRMMYPGTSRRARAHYDRRPWSLVVLAFLLLVVIAGTLAFTLGRLVDITSVVKQQHSVYEEVAIMGVNSDADIERATELMSVFDNYALTWTLAPFSEHGGLPPVVSLNWKNDTVYFSETTLTQLVPGGSGFGTFKSESTDPSASVRTVVRIQSDNSKKDADLGAILRYPRWGTRTHCAKIPDLDKNLIPFSQHEGTYLFTPRSVIQELFSSFDLPYPTIPPVDLGNVLAPGDTVPDGVDINDIDFAVRFYNNGVAHSLFSRPVDDLGNDGHGWISVEQVLVRINTTYTPNGKFARLSDQSIPDVDGNPTYIGYDALACVQLFEPWVLEVYNSTTGLPSSTRVVGKGNVIVSNNTVGHEEKRFGTPLRDIDVNRALDSSNLFSVYACGHTNSVNQMIKDNGRDSSYVPSPTVVSFTDGKGPYGYTELSPEAFARARGLSDAGNILPYFAGSGKQLARRYPDHVLASASINPIYMGGYIAGILIVGLLAGFFVPKLPFNIPHRGFEVYTWLAAFHADELTGEATSSALPRNLELDDIADQMGELKLRYTIHPHTV